MEKEVLDCSLKDFWENKAKNIFWFKKWKKILEWDYPYAKWFVGGKLNASYLCLDQNIKRGLKDKVAIYWQDESGQEQSFTYNQLYKQVNKFAYALKNIGIKKGDIVILYLPMIPQAIISMLAVARIGAIHTVVFSGFSSKSLKDRINDTKAKFLITADVGIRRGRVIPLKDFVDDALNDVSCIEKVVIVKRSNRKINLKENRDLLYDELINNSENYVEPEPVEATHPLYILYTSGTTGKPKGIVHSTGGYLVYVYNTFKNCFGIDEKTVYWCTADIGWVTGHSYVVYAPLMHGITIVMYEGAPNYPDLSVWWKIIEKYNVNIFYTSPTAIRMFMQYDDKYIKKHDLSSLKRLGSVGEVLNPQAWHWFFNKIGKGKCQIIDTWWQTETGGFMMSPTAKDDIEKLKPGSVNFPLDGIYADVVDKNGCSVTLGQKGFLIIKRPWPGIMIGIHNDDEKYKKIYWSKFKGSYYPGDYARKDEDGYFWLLGRADETLNIAGHRIGTAEIEKVAVSNEFIIEAAVAGIPDNIKGDGFVVFAVIRNGFDNKNNLKEQVILNFRNQIGAFVKPKNVYFVNSLPKTRSGKILRRVLRSIVLGESLGDITTLENEACLDEIKDKVSSSVAI
ncbi:acetate--CoA ligase [Candidatus Babeliales bacterium]|nr:acetate--CoA ligase [Candidatus Babeliales bacterium]